MVFWGTNVGTRLRNLSMYIGFLNIGILSFSGIQGQGFLNQVPTLGPLRATCFPSLRVWMVDLRVALKGLWGWYEVGLELV